MSVRVLVVEDSPVFCEFLKHILDSDPDLRVVGTAKNGAEAVEAARNLKPDVITMDISMPVMDGLEATRTIMETDPVPIVIVSVSVDPKEVATTFRALQAGALAAVQKPMGLGHPDFDETSRALVQKVKLMSEVKVVRRWPMQAGKTAALPADWSGPVLMDDIGVVAIGASTGGPAVLQAILSGFPEDFPAPVLVVQHICPGFIEGFAQSLACSCKFPIRIPTDGDELRPGHVYLAPDGRHTGVGAGGRVVLANSLPENGMRPSISYLFRTVADFFGPSAVGVLLTGMGRDGADGLKLMRQRGAVTIAQDQASCVVFGMPGEAIRIGAASHIFSPCQIVSFCAKLAKLKRNARNYHGHR